MIILTSPGLVALSLIVREKKIIERLYDYGAVSSYDETKLFRSSAAVEGNRLSTESILKHESHGLVQAVADNFDCNIISKWIKTNPFPSDDYDPKSW